MAQGLKSFRNIVYGKIFTSFQIKRFNFKHCLCTYKKGYKINVYIHTMSWAFLKMLVCNYGGK